VNNLYLKRGFSLTEALVSLLLIGIVFAVIASGLSVVLQSISMLSNQQRVIELENFIARYVYMLGTQNAQVNIENINKAFYQGSQLSYPKVTGVQTTTVGQYFTKYTFTIETSPSKFQPFIVYQYKPY
jgi:prepilin-type N-terminal cleavage/methylation domain-containing protein